MHVRSLGTVLLWGLVALGCNNQGDAVEGSSSENTESIQAVHGGTVSNDGAEVVIPPAALVEDTRVTLRSGDADDSPLPSNASGSVYEVGPLGIQFVSPVTLTLVLPTQAQDTEEYVISWFNESTNEWEDLPSTRSGSEVSAQIEQGARFVVRAKTSAALDCSFSACGGDPTGTWTAVGACTESTHFAPSWVCPKAKVDTRIEVEGTFTLGADKTISGSFSMAGSVSMQIPSECMKQAGMSSCHETTTDVKCSGKKADGCTCTSSIDADTNLAAGRWSASGTTLTTVKKGSQREVSEEFCVRGDTLRIVGANGVVLVFGRVSSASPR